MGLALVVLAAARPHADGWSQNQIGGACAAAAVVLFVVGDLVYKFLQDRRIHEGVSSFKRRRVLRSGVAANATVLSSLRIERKTSGMEVLSEPATGNPFGTAYYSNVYEVVTPSGETFRAKGIEKMPTDSGKVSRHACRHFELQPGETVAVKYDPVDRTIVLVNPEQKLHEAWRLDAAADRAKEDARRATEAAKKENEARLLRGDPPT
jgi:hypothetical protein